MNGLDNSTRLHNMSAPPRTIVTFRPVRSRPHENAKQGGDSGAAAIGMRWICRIDVVNRCWPCPPGVGRDPAEGADWPSTREPERLLAAQALAEERGLREADGDLVAEINAMPVEEVYDRLRDVARRVDLRALSFPRVALVVPASESGRRIEIADMRVAVGVLSRRRGTIFLRDAEPAPTALNYRAVDLWEICPGGEERGSHDAR